MTLDELLNKTDVHVASSRGNYGRSFWFRLVELFSNKALHPLCATDEDPWYVGGRSKAVEWAEKHLIVDHEGAILRFVR